VCARVLSLTAIAYPRIKPSKHGLKAPSHTGCDFRVDITRHQLGVGIRLPRNDRQAEVFVLG
jgi:hypothetical protein